MPGDPSIDRIGDDLADGADVGEVTGLRPVAVHRERFVAQGGVDERGNDGRVRMTGLLPGAVHVEEAEGERAESEAVLPGERILLGGELAGRVRAAGQGGQPLVFGEFGVGAVHRRRRCDDHVGVVEPSCHLEHSHRADGVRFVGGDRIVDRPGDRRARREVDDALCPCGCVGEGIGVEDRPRDQTHVEVVEVGGGSRRQVVDPDDLVAVAQQSLTDVGADEPCGTGDEDPHWGEPTDRVGCHRVPLPVAVDPGSARVSAPRVSALREVADGCPKVTGHGPPSRAEMFAGGHEQGGEVAGATSPRQTLHAGEPDALAPGMHERGECVRLGRRGLDTGRPSTERSEIDAERLPGTHDACGDEWRASEPTGTVGHRLGRRCGLRGEDDHVGRRAESDVRSARRVDGGVHDPADRVEGGKAAPGQRVLDEFVEERTGVRAHTEVAADEAEVQVDLDVGRSPERDVLAVLLLPSCAERRREALDPGAPEVVERCGVRRPVDEHVDVAGGSQ